MSLDERILNKTTRAALVALVLVTTIILWLEGRVWWCSVGDLSPWSWDIWSKHNSQHIIDPYSFTHVLHGVLEFWLIGLLFRKVQLAWRLLIALCIEAGWEVAENSSYVINRYREVTISLDYFGDSIINSIAGVSFCALGFVIAWRLGLWRSLVFFLATEAILIWWIRDSLLINVVMLLYPIEAIRLWQMPH